MERWTPPKLWGLFLSRYLSGLSILVYICIYNEPTWTNQQTPTNQQQPKLSWSTLPETACPLKIVVSNRNLRISRGSISGISIITPLVSLTPWKINMEPTNHPLKERNMIFQTPMIMFLPLIFRGVIRPYWTIRLAMIERRKPTSWIQDSLPRCSSLDGGSFAGLFWLRCRWIDDPIPIDDGMTGRDGTSW